MTSDADGSNPLTVLSFAGEDTAERPRRRDSMETRNCRAPRSPSTLQMWADPVTQPPTPWRPGHRIDRYELVEQIGVGGMGVVWAALDLDLGREVAIKLSFPSLHARLLGEAQAMARLSHPNVVTIHDVGWTGDGGLFLAMERIDGGTLGEWLHAVPRAWDEVIEKFAAAGRGLGAVHRAGLVHRDFKPDNVLLGADGVARVSDFGLAIPLAEAGRGPGFGRDRPRTLEIAPVGTLAYMAPEQLAGYAVTPRSDLFGFCLALYEALWGGSAFGAAWTEAPAAYYLAAAAEGRVPVAPPDGKAPGRVRDVVLRGLAYDPEDRWPAMDSLVFELERCLPRLRRP
jgi:serine/threonine protein kinase